MTAQRISATQVAPQPWRNGGGRTRELLVWPSAQDWMLRVSLADIDADGPFSAFPGVQRCFAVVAGAGVALGFADTERRVVAGDVPLCFDGGSAPTCRLLDGPTLDLNLMSRHGKGVMRKIVSGTAWQEAFAIRALFTGVAGRWSGEGGSLHIAAHTLLWDDTLGSGGTAQSDRDDSAAWTFVPAAAAPTCAAGNPGAAVAGCWLGFTPNRSPDRADRGLR